MTLIEITRRLAADLDQLSFKEPVSHVYNPLDYAWKCHEAYLQRYGQGPKEIVFLGMNPGPWGMAQTGIPFGEVAVVRDWLQIDELVARPAQENPAKPVTGLACRRSEVSGRRLWGLFREKTNTPERFFSRFFVLNYCPLLFLEQSGRNRTPVQLPLAERKKIMEICDEALRRMVAVLGAKTLVGIGQYAEERAREALSGQDLRIGRILHPSPASPAANRDWAGTVERQLEELGIRFE
ncbi:single-strand selective monofunctional uracil DNA glycosylase [Geoalkalibacter ferrihydriticus]|uniref:Single-stranded DNA-binding protein n=2 Tax=Geoalkalibacter ferrihydriticus TaxID=392333 RepID=A0A0C2DXC4_9BACT|nr:uracil-DNA glycosylase family protein [Geoalkalibacter ferrihydriticus]KIH78094.1 single-stranded DNA-binding protein [Geoalkalibacter ferrihydriticus DSM 17813]SDM78009.1 single-strand selective monofunctional uracil DNA glycosylase [Geoalkalibacter ferrihydriticus]